ncbi:MAG: hypothetical protein JWM82_2745 [Myxococcales bacterium]|nr:hypothetical protein [Myxococcales bacterium]
MTSKLPFRSRSVELALGLAWALACGAGCGGSKLVSSDAGAAGKTGSAGADGAASDGVDATLACPVGGTGKLLINTLGLPTGVVPMVRVMGGTLATEMPLTPGTAVTLDAGNGYVFGWRRVKVAATASALLGKAFYLSSQPWDGCIKKDFTTMVNLTYSQEPGSEKLWVTVSNSPNAATIGHVIAGFDGADLVASATKNPTVWKSDNFTGRGAAGAIDSYGNFWVPGGDRINQYDMAHLAISTNAPPAVTLTQPASASAKFAALDASGNLWVSRGGPTTDNAVVRYDASQLGSSGTPTPSVVIKSSSFMEPAGIAFDDVGDLWVADAGNAKVLMFLAAHLAASSTAAADIVLSAGSGSNVAAAFTNPNGLAFDKAKNLWVGFEGVLVMFTPAQQAGSANLMGPTAPAALMLSTGTGAFAFDESGGLWMGGRVSGKVERFPKSQLDTAAAMTPPTPAADIIIDSTAMLGDTESLVINPSPSWSNLHDDY